MYMIFDDIQPLFEEPLFGSDPIVLAGPCSAESERQVLDTADALAAGGIRIFRAGVWKPRTKPGGFEGIGSPALQWLAKVRERTGMLTATEVASRAHLEEALDAGIDVLWIGARTTANPFAVQDIADGLAALPSGLRESIPVLVKNPVNPDLELWIGALERIYRAGIRRLGAIHRGFSSYGKHIYRNPPKWRIPIELRRRIPSLTVICDPSHLGGRREYIASLSQQALDMGFDGLMIESHCDPASALSDSAQQVTPAELAAILAGLRRHTASSSTESLSQLRDSIDRIDIELLELLGKRMALAREIGRYKREHSMSVVQSGRYNDLMQNRVDDAARLDLSADFVSNILSAIHEESVRQQVEICSKQD